MNSSEHPPRPLTEGERTMVAAIAAAVGALGLVGFVISFTTVMEAARDSFGPLAFLLPLGIDLGIAAFSALDIVMARLDMRVRWLRLVPWALTAATVYLNVSRFLSAEGGPKWFDVIAHGLLPLLWVVAVEVGTHAVRKRAKLARTERMQAIRLSRWLMAPLPTFALWRRMVLWEIRSYPEALMRERERILARTDLQDRYGRLWRLKASRRERALYRLGELAPQDAPIRAEAVRLAPAPATPTMPPRGELPPAPRKPRASASGKRARTVKRSAPPDVDELMPLGWQIAADLEAQGLTLTRDRLLAAVRATGQSISSERASALLARLKAEAPAEAAEAVPAQRQPEGEAA